MENSDKDYTISVLTKRHEEHIDKIIDLQDKLHTVQRELNKAHAEKMEEYEASIRLRRPTYSFATALKEMERDHKSELYKSNSELRKKLEYSYQRIMWAVPCSLLLGGLIGYFIRGACL